MSRLMRLLALVLLPSVAQLVHTDEKHLSGEWRIRYEHRQTRVPEEVVVAFRGKGANVTVEVSKGALER